ncbi:thiamine pyrophosphate-binding protein [Bradyrhizobium neotropicale]|uniref:thiamine pyrophosphate-binding protein n=1 Tax=Bradyrhizobium neotropicale TaxID=1497615 RepID=UPI001AD6DDA5|nr:thiamine pyrophosphate-binding protein [Bradyrhizobium neotropicale]MBO4223939.1 thiamine pyrophosphate-binding protein [Bradyrhizobium neotropicale]
MTTSQPARAKIGAARAVVQCLKLEGVEFIFGVPGGQTLSIMDALYDEPGIRFITTRDERAAAHMADAYGRLTGKPGVCLATTGPGATNLITAVGGAHRDSSPVVVITCNNRRRHIGQDDNQDADHITLFRQFTKLSRFVPDSEGIPQAVREAFRVATTGNPGPVLLDFARDAVEGGEIAFEPIDPQNYRFNERPVAPEASIAAAAQALAAARKPVLWLGRGAIIARAGEAALKLAELLGAPIVTSFNGISAVPGDHDLCFGPRSRFGTKVSKHLLQDSDCILVVGNSMNAASTSRWTLPLTRNIVQVDLDPAIVGRNYPVAVGVIGDATDALRRLAGALQGKLSANAAARADWLAQARRLREDWRKDVFAPAYATSRPIKPQWVMQTLGAAIDANTVIVADAGNPGVWTHMLPIKTPGAYMKPVGYGNMAFGLPAAIAAKLAGPGKDIIAVVGDGSLGMSMGDMETAVREKAPFTLIVMNDMAYGNIKQEELHFHGQRYIGVDFGDVDYAGVAKCMGGDGEKVSNPADLAAAIARGKASGRFYLIDVRIDGSENVWKDPI